jgi:flagellar L-ring protein precursor FlgH
MKRRIGMLAVCVAGMILTADATAGSIYAKKNQTAKGVFSDDKAGKVGDVLTIVISENTKIDNKVKRDLSKETSNSLDFNGKDVQVGNLITSIPSLRFNAESSKSLNGKSDYKDERKFEDRITVVVIDIHPNGNLVVMGTREREVGGDKQIIQASGIVQPRDILYDNSIRSEQVANFKLISINEGVTKSYNEPGWLGKIVDFLWPF